jgi:hypothetical protein
VVSFTPRPLYSQGKNPWYPLDGRLGGPQSRCGRGGVKKKPASAGTLPSLPIIQLIAQHYTTELYRILAVMDKADEK